MSYSTFAIHIVAIASSLTVFINPGYGSQLDLVSGLGPGTCFRATIFNLSSSVHLETPVIFYHQNYYTLYISVRAAVAFVKHHTGGYRPHPSIENPLDIIKQPFLTPLYTFGTEGDVCYWETKNSTIIQEFASSLTNVTKENMGISLFRWSLIIIKWNEIIISFRAQSDMNSTFQAALLTDGKATYSQFSYGFIYPATNYVVGFNAGKSTFETNRWVLLGREFTGPPKESDLPVLTDIYRIDGDCVTRVNDSCHYSTYATSCSMEDILAAASCDCLKGYINHINGTCSDIDECLTNPCEQICVNLPGTYVCQCKFSYILADDGVSCKDIDECALQHDCEHNCTNTVGSYSCTCITGYLLSPDRHSCVDVDECESLGACEGGEICVNTEGSFMCFPGCGILEVFVNNMCTVSKDTVIGFTTGFSFLVLIGAIFGLLFALAATCHHVKKRKRLIYDIPSTVL